MKHVIEAKDLETILAQYVEGTITFKGRDVKVTKVVPVVEDEALKEFLVTYVLAPEKPPETPVVTPPPFVEPTVPEEAVVAPVATEAV